MSTFKEKIGNIVGTLFVEAVSAAFTALPCAIIGAVVCAFLGMAKTGAFWGATLGGTLGAVRMFYWYIQGWRLQNIGYIPPEPSKLEKLIYLWLCKAVARIVLGRVIFIGSENAHFEGRLLISPNHQHGMDFILARLAIPFSFRQIGAAKEVKGWRAGPAAFSGAYAVPVQGGRSTDPAASQKVIDNSAKLFKQGKHRKVGLFLQGKLVFDNVQRPEDYRTGGPRMLKIVWEDTNHEPLAVLPMAMHYWPSSKNVGLFRRAMVWLWSKLFPGYGSEPKYGATVVVGKPIEFSTLPENPRAAVEQIRLHIVALLEQAVAATEEAQGCGCSHRS